MNEENLFNFILNGHVKGTIPFIKDINFDSYSFHDCNYESGEESIVDTNLWPIIYKCRDFLIDNYVSQIFSNFELKNMSAWKNVDGGSSVWHNDQKEKLNSNILVYLDDSYNKNTIEIKTPSKVHKIYPQKGNFVWLNQSLNFQHKATHLEGERRLISFEFDIPELWT